MGLQEETGHQVARREGGRLVGVLLGGVSVDLAHRIAAGGAVLCLDRQKSLVADAVAFDAFDFPTNAQQQDENRVAETIGLARSLVGELEAEVHGFAADWSALVAGQGTIGNYLALVVDEPVVEAECSSWLVSSSARIRCPC